MNLKAYEEKGNNSFVKIIYRPLLIKKMILFFETAIAPDFVIASPKNPHQIV